MQASISSTNKGQSITFVTDTMGSVTLKAVHYKTGIKECFVMREDEGIGNHTESKTLRQSSTLQSTKRSKAKKAWTVPGLLLCML